MRNYSYYVDKQVKQKIRGRVVSLGANFVYIICGGPSAGKPITVGIEGCIIDPKDREFADGKCGARLAGGPTPPAGSTWSPSPASC